jgi:hypothetical protein
MWILHKATVLRRELAISDRDSARPRASLRIDPEYAACVWLDSRVGDEPGTRMQDVAPRSRIG